MLHICPGSFGSEKKKKKKKKKKIEIFFFPECTWNLSPLSLHPIQTMDGRDDNALGQRQGTHRRTPLGQIGETYLLECCGEKRPWAEDARLELKTGGAFLTVHEYVPVVHPWLTGMRDRILEVQSKLRSHSAPWPPETNLAVVRAPFNADLGFDDAKGWTKWHEKPRERPPGATPGHVGGGKEEERNRLAMERALARSAARIRKLENVNKE